MEYEGSLCLPKIRDLFESYNLILKQLAECKRDIAKEALSVETCPVCGFHPKTSKWVITLTQSEPLTERLLCVCSNDHEWYTGGKNGTGC